MCPLTATLKLLVDHLNIVWEIIPLSKIILKQSVKLQTHAQYMLKLLNKGGYAQVLIQTLCLHPTPRINTLF